jgi:ATP-binding cassette subfamily B protein
MESLMSDPASSTAELTLERLREIPLLAALDDTKLATLITNFVCERVRAGQTMFREGDPGEHFHILVHGTMTVTQSDAAGGQREIAGLSDGDEFGEMALLHDGRRNATITATSECLILTLTRVHFDALLASAPGLRDSINKLAANRAKGGADYAFLVWLSCQP